MSEKGGNGASSGFANPLPLFPNSAEASGDAGATGDKSSLLVRGLGAAIPVGLSKLDREGLQVGTVASGVETWLCATGYPMVGGQV